MATGPRKHFSETYFLNLDISIWSVSCFLKEIDPCKLMMTPLKSTVWWLVSWHPRRFRGSVCWWAAACECGTRGSAEVAYLCRVAYEKVWSVAVASFFVEGKSEVSKFLWHETPLRKLEEIAWGLVWCNFNGWLGEPEGTWVYHRFQTVVGVFHSSLMLIITVIGRHLFLEDLSTWIIKSSPFNMFFWHSWPIIHNLFQLGWYFFVWKVKIKKDEKSPGATPTIQVILHGAKKHTCDSAKRRQDWWRPPAPPARPLPPGASEDTEHDIMAQRAAGAVAKVWGKRFVRMTFGHFFFRRGGTPPALAVLPSLRSSLQVVVQFLWPGWCWKGPTLRTKFGAWKGAISSGDWCIKNHPSI